MNTLKEKWARGEPTLGLWSTLGSTLATETLGRTGFDYVCVDNQHGINDYAGTVGHLQALDIGDVTPLARPPWNEPGIMGKLLDAGAEGLIIPMVNSAAEAEAAVRSSRYAPEGSRSFGPVRAAERRSDYFEVANELVACIPMIETAAAVAAIDEILAVPGIDAIYVGPADLAVSLGFAPRDADAQPVFNEALDTIVSACSRHGVVPGIHATTAIAEQRLELGFRMVTVSADSVAMRVGLAQAGDVLARVRGAVSAESDGAAGDSIY